MDLGAYVQIEDLESVMKANCISVPRLRGLRLMKEEEPTPEDAIEKEAYSQGVFKCKDLCESFFRTLYPDTFCLLRKTDRIIKKYLVLEDNLFPKDIRWKAVRGRKRKMFKYTMKMASRKVRKQYEIFNKYCGREDVLYIHARIGGGNWSYFGGAEISKQPWFIEKVDDAFDCTYCDIYARIK